ncbi:MAG: hypothetical protein HC880_19440, partial [Bacteroidia bacterium]|nr:hypothetical protein [Bacteroidia bacterium]
TDHGTGGTVFVFGQEVKPGMLGTNPDLTRNNIEMQFDYRQVYASILKDWFCVSPELVDVGPEDDTIFKGSYIGRGGKPAPDSRQRYQCGRLYP